MGFGLKTVARSLKDHGLIQTDWPDGVTDGLGADGHWVVVCRCCPDGRCVPIGCRPDVRGIRLNEVDCKVMMEAVACLRERF